MTRRFQFSLRALLVAVLACGLVLGALRSRDWQHVSAEPVDTSQPFRIKGRLIRLFGPKKWQISVLVLSDEPEPYLVKLADIVSERSWLCVYPINVCAYWPEAGKYKVLVGDSDRPLVQAWLTIKEP